MNVFWIGMGFSQIFKCVVGLVCLIVGLFNKEFKPNSWTSRFICGTGDDARTPRWIAGPVFVAFGLLMLYRGLTGR
jgi:hypothetical protein